MILVKKFQGLALLVLLLLIACQWSGCDNKYEQIDKLLHRGFKSDSLQDYHASILIYDSVLKIEPANFIGFVNRGRAKVFTGDTIGGLKDLDNSIRIHPSPEAFLTKSLIFLFLGKPKQAYSELRAGNTLFPEEGKITSGLTLYYDTIHHVRDSALYYADYTMRLSVKKPQLYFAPMNVYLRYNDYPNLLKVTDSIIAYLPEEAYSYNNRGLAKLNLGDINGAKHDIVTSLNLDSNNAWAYRNMGLVFEKMMEPDSSCYYVQRARQKDIMNEYKRNIDSLVLKFCRKK